MKLLESPLQLMSPTIKCRWFGLCSGQCCWAHQLPGRNTGEREINFALWCLISPQGLFPSVSFPLPFESYIQITTCMNIQRNTAQHVFVKVQKTIWHYTCSICCSEFSASLLLQIQKSSDKGKVCCSVRKAYVPSLISPPYCYHFQHLFCNLKFFFSPSFSICSSESKQQVRNHYIWEGCWVISFWKAFISYRHKPKWEWS